ncbi:MAG: DUF5110 domain-containing protein [Candidatus Adiutrix sp.]|jgi:alpha-glucosidase|nr:DUF5110 domain-containing protein [Candidatus Adiutrix sp.]
MFHCHRPGLALCLTLLLTLATAAGAQAQKSVRAVTRLGPFGLSLALVNDQVWLFEFSADSPPADQPLELSSMISPAVRLRSPAGGGDSWSSPSVRVQLSQSPPAITITNQDGGRLFTLSPYAPDGQLTGLNFTGDYSHLLGLGSDIQNSSGKLNLLGTQLRPAGPFGNGRVPMFGALANQVQPPVIYALGDGQACGAILVDETRPLMWNLKGQPWSVYTAGPLGPGRTFRFLLITGPDMKGLRGQLMDLTGRPPVPPKQALGVWASGLTAAEPAGWENELNLLKTTVPGLAGLLTSPDPDLKTKSDMIRGRDLRLMLDESAYVPEQSPYYDDMARRAFLVRQPSGSPLVVNHLGQPSALVDYTNGAAATFWHSLFRAGQISAGVSSFRLTDGDLEDASISAYYEGSPGSQAHSHYAWANVFPLKWLEGVVTSIKNQRMMVRPRLLFLSRTGLPGLSRLSGALYNGEASLFITRAAQAYRAHLALSGFDYYSSDLSHNLLNRPLDQNLQIYDTWLAKNALTDIPLILPAEMLLRQGARYNLALRESLGPYYYSLAWESYLSGQPLLAPLAYHFQDDLLARDRTGELMLGQGLLIGLDFDGAAERADVYVPQGRWYNWRTGEVIDQKESGLVSLDLKDAGQLTPPILARAGAIIPGLADMPLKGGHIEKTSSLKIFIGEEKTSDFTWYEDDGETLAYQNNLFSRTNINAVTHKDGSTVVTIQARDGHWDGAPTERRLLVDIYGPKAPGEATLDNLPHNRVARIADLDQLDSGWASIGTNRIRFKTPPLDTSVDHILWFK